MRDRVLFLAVFLPVCIFFAGIAKTSRSDFLSLQRDKTDLYNHLTRALLAGQTDLLIKPRPGLLALKDPYNVEVARPYQLHDASLYNGKYYVYFGLTPVVTLLLPFRLLTGTDLSVGIATLFFAILGYGLSCRLFLSLIHTAPGSVPAWVKLGGYLSLGLCVFVPLALRSCNTYELASMSAYCFFMAGSYILFRAVQATNRRALLLIMAGVCLGLCAGGRPNYAVGVALVVGLVAAMMLRIVKTVKISGRDFLCFSAPVVLCGLCLAAYNYARFGSPLDFGFKYQLTDESGLNNLHFGVRNLAYGAFYQLLSLPDFSRSFPFVHNTIQRFRSDYLPAGMIIYPVTGAIAAMPLILLGLLPFPGALAWRRLSANCGPERMTIIVQLLVAGTNFLVISALGTYCGRYFIDFAPSLVLIGLVSLALWLNGSGIRYRKIAAAGACVLVLGCACEGASFGLSGGNGTDYMFLAHPALYLRTIVLFNHITGGQTPSSSADVYLDASVTFSGARTGLMEPILTCGHAGMATFVGVRYPAPGQAQFYYQHLERLADFGKVVDISPGKPYDLHVRMNPISSSVTVELDGTIVYDRRVPLYPVQLNEIAVGRNPVWSPGRAESFSGKLEVRRFSAKPSALWRADETPVPSVTAP